jgi:selenocysteine lyase/cysteine desulfurase
MAAHPRPVGPDGPSREESHTAFLKAHPEYAETHAVDDLRARDFERLDREGHVYLDYTGSGLYGASQVERHSKLLLTSVLGNPHSANPASAASTRLVEGTRERVLHYFHASPDEYAVVFTANASHALKLVGEAYPFSPGDQFLLTFDNHNSVNGIREFDRARGARTVYVPMIPPDLRVDEKTLDLALAALPPGRRGLFAYPAQSNFSGVQHPLAWVEKARALGWHVLLDAAAYVPTHALDLSVIRPDFVTLSFYKMFGYPTGVGALLARREALEVLHRPWFAGGTINVASVQADRHVPAAGVAAFEDGTVDFGNIPAVALGLDLIESVGVANVRRRVHALTGWLLQELKGLLHGNGVPLVRVYGPLGLEARGATVAFNLQDPEGRVLDHLAVEEAAAREGISLRTGCFCNPGAGEVAMGLTREELEHCFVDGAGRMTYDDLRRCIDPHAAGAVRVSLGLVSNFSDVWTFARFAAGFLRP